MKPLENTEEFINVIHIKAYPIIPYKENKFFSLLCASYSYFCFGTGNSILYCVGDKVENSKPKHSFITIHLGQCSYLPFYIPFFNIGSHFFDNVLCNTSHVYCRLLHISTPHSGKCKKVVDEHTHLS